MFYLPTGRHSLQCRCIQPYLPPRFDDFDSWVSGQFVLEEGYHVLTRSCLIARWKCHGQSHVHWYVVVWRARE